jgi:hypothetical protein
VVQPNPSPECIGGRSGRHRHGKQSNADDAGRENDNGEIPAAWAEV